MNSKEILVAMVTIMVVFHYAGEIPHTKSSSQTIITIKTSLPTTLTIKIQILMQIKQINFIKKYLGIVAIKY
jgi:hypothetical protein